MPMDWKLEVVVVPVADIDRAKHFYSEQVGFVVDHDTKFDENYRTVQLTPPGSACSISVGTGFVNMLPGSVKGLQLVVSDIEAARTELMARGVTGSARSSTTKARSWLKDAVVAGIRLYSLATLMAMSGSYRSDLPVNDAASHQNAWHHSPVFPRRQVTNERQNNRGKSPPGYVNVTGWVYRWSKR